MPLVFFIFASVLNPMLPIGAFFATLFGIAALQALYKRRLGAALGWASLFCAAGWLGVASLPVEPPRYEANAIGDCRSVSAGQAAYAHFNNGYYGSPRCLENPTRCGFPDGVPTFMDRELASLSIKGKYARSFFPGAPGKGRPDPGIKTFVYVARPAEIGGDTRRTFAVDHTGRICYTLDGSMPPIIDGALSPACIEIE